MKTFAEEFLAGFLIVMGWWYLLKADAERWHCPWENRERFPAKSETCDCVPDWFDYEMDAFEMGAKWAEGHFDEIVASFRASGHPVPEDADANDWNNDGGKTFGDAFGDCFDYRADRDSAAPFGVPWVWSDFWAWFDPSLSPCEMAEQWYEKCSPEFGDDYGDDEDEDEGDDDGDAGIGDIQVRLPASMREYYYQGPGDLEPWDACFVLELDCDVPKLSVTRHLGGGRPADVAFGRSFWFDFPAASPLKDVRACMKEIAPLCVSLAETWDTEWNGSNEIGVYDEDAEAAVQEAVDEYFEVR